MDNCFSLNIPFVFWCVGIKEALVEETREVLIKFKLATSSKKE
jgi:hypothetical protein